MTNDGLKEDDAMAERAADIARRQRDAVKVLTLEHNGDRFQKRTSRKAMTDDELEDNDARTHAVVLVPLSDDLWAAADPDLVADALAAQLQRVLEFVVAMDLARASWALALLGSMQVAVLAASDTAAAPRH